MVIHCGGEGWGWAAAAVVRDDRAGARVVGSGGQSGREFCRGATRGRAGGLGVTGVLVAAVGVELRRYRLGRRAANGEIGLDAAADQLAVAVGVQWRREEELRRVHTPFPLPVRWHAAPAELMDHLANVGRVPAGVPAGRLELAGELGRVVETYRCIPSQRLVVLGRAGSGKTVLALRFVLDLLDRRGPGEPVPVVSVSGRGTPAVRRCGTG